METTIPRLRNLALPESVFAAMGAMATAMTTINPGDGKLQLDQEKSRKICMLAVNGDRPRAEALSQIFSEAIADWYRVTEDNGLTENVVPAQGV